MKWRQELGVDFCESLYDFGMAHLDIYRVMNVTKYRSFQYRLMQRGIVTNIQLCKWNLAGSELCYFCHENRETIMHLLYNCQIVKELWSRVEIFLIECMGISNITIDEKNVFWNKIVPNRRSVGNFICLLTKQYIYRQKCMGRNLNFPS